MGGNQHDETATGKKNLGGEAKGKERMNWGGRESNTSHFSFYFHFTPWSSCRDLGSYAIPPHGALPTTNPVAYAARPSRPLKIKIINGGGGGREKEVTHSAAATNLQQNESALCRLCGRARP